MSSIFLQTWLTIFFTRRLRSYVALSLGALIVLCAQALTTVAQEPLRSTSIEYQPPLTMIFPASDTTIVYPPEIAFVPRNITLEFDTAKQIEAEVKVLNPGGSALHISEIIPSCGCASATIMKNPLYPMETTKLRIRLNTSTITDSVMRVTFTIKSNAIPQILDFHVMIHKKNIH